LTRMMYVRTLFLLAGLRFLAALTPPEGQSAVPEVDRVAAWDQERRLATQNQDNVHLERQKEVLGVLNAIGLHKEAEGHTHRTTTDPGASITQTSLAEVETIINRDARDASPEVSPAMRSDIARIKAEVKREHLLGGKTDKHTLPPPVATPAPTRILPPWGKPKPVAKETAAVLSYISALHSSDESDHILCDGGPCSEFQQAASPSVTDQIVLSLPNSMTCFVGTLLVGVALTLLSITVVISYSRHKRALPLNSSMHDPTHSEESTHFMYEAVSSPYQTSRDLELL